ncbi:MAG: hypothetical protein HKM04_03695, partial [Legionellales bacterium]|nr:hypothetical protein [Legionellales bacterium]
QVTPQAEAFEKILAFCVTPKTREEIQEFLGFKDRKHFRLEIMSPLIAQGLLRPTIPDKLTSPKQQYYTVKRKDSDHE